MRKRDIFPFDEERQRVVNRKVYKEPLEITCRDEGAVGEMLSVNSTCPEVGTSAGAASPFVWKYCRMCALEVKQGVYIFGEEGKRLQIPEKIRKTVAILVLEEDSLPKKICTSCCTSLEAYTQFKDSVVDAQEKLSAIAKSIEKSQEQSYLQLRNKQSIKSPKRQKMYHSSLPSHSACHIMFPTPSNISAPEPDLSEPAIECDEPPSSVASMSSEEEENTVSKSASECVASSEMGLKNDESTQIALQGHSPPLSSNKQPSREAKTYSYSSQSLSENDDFLPKNVSSKSPVYNGENSIEHNIQGEAQLVCGLCKYSFKDKDSLIPHHNKSHNNNDTQSDPVYGCSACPRISSNYEAIRQHIHGHRLTGMFKCPDCDKGFSTKDHLHVHITSKHNQQSSKSVGSQSYAKQISTNITMTSHERKKCPGPTNTTAGVTIENTHQIGESSYNHVSENPPCTGDEVCAATTESKELGHFESSAAVNFSISPTKTPEKNDSSHALVKVDLNSNSRSATIDTQEQGGQKEASNLSLSDEKDGYWKCDYCDKILRSKNGYDTHVAAHKGRRFSCEQCGVTYTQKSSLEHHVKVHHTNVDKEFECPECSKRFKTFRQLGWHKKTHEKPLTDVRCPQCEKTFKNMISFKTHMKLHRGSKKFACVQCPKAFYTKAKLQEHMNSHSGKRPFGCPVENCLKVFSCFSNYAKHFKKHHHSMLGPKGSMIPPPKIVESNNNVVPLKQNEYIHQKKVQVACVKATQNAGTLLMQKESVISGTSGATTKSQEVTQVATSSQSHVPTSEAHSHNTLAVHPSFQTGTTVENSSTQTVLRPLPGIFSGSSSTNLGVQTSSTSSQTFSSQTPCSNISLLPSNSNGHSHSSPLSLHANSSVSTTENISLAHTQSQSVPIGSLQSHSHHHVHHPGNVHAHNSTHSAHSNHAANSATQTHHANQFQSQNHIQTVWQPVVLPNSKNYHNPSASASLSTINGLELLDCAGTVHSSESLASNNNNNNNSNSSNHSHSQHQQSNNVNVNSSSVNAAHHATSHSSVVVVHAHHGVNLPSSGHTSNAHIGGSHHGPISSSVTHSTASSSGHGLPVSSTSSTVNIPNFGSLTQQNEPMELSYKDSNNFQDMPMELTKVFQRDPLELCVRQDFGHTQPLMDLSSRVVNVTVGGNSSMNVSTMSMNLNGNGSNTSSSTNTQSHYTSISNGTGSTSTSILSVPYHNKTVELVERELSLNDFTGAFRQPIDLISRSEEQSHELCSEGNLVDLSLRSSFGQDQSASSFLRELIDLSSRSDSFHGEVNLTNKQPQSSSNSHSQIHHHSHSSGHHPIPKSASTSNSVSGHHHHHNNHHTHHHHAIQSHQSSSGSGSTGAAPLQPVMYPDTSAMFNLQN